MKMIVEVLPWEVRMLKPASTSRTIIHAVLEAFKAQQSKRFQQNRREQDGLLL
jgi:hypothetical protein